MRKLYLLLLIGFVCTSGFSQSFSFSTFREVYDFAPGDTFETRCWNHLTWLSPYNDIENVYLDIILARQDLDNLIIYTVKRNRYYHWTDGIHNTYSTGTDTILVDYSMLDSIVFWDHTHLSPGCDSSFNCLFDSVYLDSTITSGRINEHRWEDWGGGEDTIYADGIGLFRGGIGSEDPGVTQGGCGLIYYHKVNNSKWGHPYFFIVSGVGDLSKELNLSIHPNPSITSFTLQLSTQPSNQTYLQLYDAIGRQVKREEITSATTTINRNNLPSGIYFWQLLQGNKILSRGKLVIE